MIACEICESPQFLQIIESQLGFNGHSGQPDKLYEKYHCTWCGPTAVGALSINEDGEKNLTGGITDMDQAQPRAEI